MRYITVPSILEQSVRSKMEETLNICRKHYYKDIPTPTLKFSQMGHRAGVCSLNYFNVASSTVVINPDYFKNHYDNMLNDTVPHEVAHYVAGFLHGRVAHGHGCLWKNVMSVIGIRAAERCHEYSLEGVKTRQVKKPYKYTCSCHGEHNEHLVTEHVHRRHQLALSAGHRGYRCSRCKTHLIYQGFTHNGQFIPAKKPESPVKIVQVFNIVPPKPVIKETESMFKTITRFVNGSLENVQVPI